MKMLSVTNKCVLLTIVLFVLGHIPTYGQPEKDEFQYKKLEEKARMEIDKSIAKFQADTAKKKHSISNTGAATEVPQTSLSYDKFKDLTTLSILSPVYHQLSPPLTGAIGKYTDQIADTDLIGTYTYNGQQYLPPAQFVLIFKTLSSGVFFGSSPSFILIADSTRYRLGNMAQSLDRHGTLAYEYVSIAIPFETFLNIVNADRVEVQIGNFDFPLSNHNLNALRRLSGQLEKEPPLPEIVAAPKADNSVAPVANSTWVNKDGIEVTFNIDGTLSNSAIQRNFRWVQNGDVIRFEILDPGIRTLGVGIVRGEHMVNRFRAKVRFGEVTSSEVLQLKRAGR